jgi:CRP-like cAMP-binding protein
MKTEGNQILAMLPREEVERLERHLESVALVHGQLLEDAGEPASHLYFVTDGAISTVGPTHGGESVEVALTGREGVAGACAAIGPLAFPPSR